MKRPALIILLLSALLMACQRTKPQSPSIRNGIRHEKTDSTVLRMLELNQRMAAQADQDIIRYVQQSALLYAQEHIGYWLAYIAHSEDTTTLYKDASVDVRMRVMRLDETLLMDTEQTYTIGRAQLPDAVDHAVRHHHPGEHLRLVAPWYVAYGREGNEHIQPYENVIFDIEIR